MYTPKRRENSIIVYIKIYIQNKTFHFSISLFHFIFCMINRDVRKNMCVCEYLTFSHRKYRENIKY